MTPPPSPRRGQAGWSLTETLVALALAGVLTAWAWPRWSQARQVQWRVQAQLQLQQLAQDLSWENLLTAKRPTALSPAQAQVAGLPYRFELQASNTPQADPLAYVIWAKPMAEQTTDPCGALWLDSAGRRGNAGAPRTATACWGRTP